MGGLAGHMMNPQEDLRLGHKDFENLLETQSFRYHEKLDGINVHLLKHNGEIRVARGKKDFETNGIGLDEIDERFAKSGAKDLFKFAIQRVNQQHICEFDGKYTFNCEIIKGCTNVIHYDAHGVYIHGLQNWETGEYRPNLEKVFVEVSPLDPLYKEEILSNLHDTLGDKTLGELYFERFVELTGCTDRDVFGRLWDNMKLLKTQSEYRDIQDNWKAIRYEIVMDIDKICLEVGEHLKQHSFGAYGTFSDWNKVLHKLQDGDRDSMRFMSVYKEGMNTFEGLVFSYRGIEYKWTGIFGPLNKLMW